MLVLRGHGNTVRCLAFAPDGALLASGGDDGTVKLWDVRAGAEVATFAGHRGSVKALAFSPDGNTLLAGADGGDVRLWDVAAGSARSLWGQGGLAITAAAFSPDGRWVAAGAERVWREAPLGVWEVASGQVWWQTLEASLPRRPNRYEPAPWPAGVWSLAFAPDSATLAVGTSRGWVGLWDVPPLRERRRLTLSGGVRALAFTPDGQTLITSQGTPVRVWDLDSGVVRLELGEPGRIIESIALSPDGRTLAGGLWDSSVRLWELATGWERGRYDFRLGRIFAVAVAPDGMTAAAGGDAKEVVLLDIDP
jgi:WD40 repeat protein